MCCLGGSGLGDTKTRSTGTQIILEHMNTIGISKIIVCSSLSASDSSGHLSFIARMFLKSVLRNPMIDHTAQEEEVLRNSD